MRLLKAPSLLLVGTLLLAWAGSAPAQDGAPGKLGVFEALKHKDRQVRRSAADALAKVAEKLGPRAK